MSRPFMGVSVDPQPSLQLPPDSPGEPRVSLQGVGVYGTMVPGMMLPVATSSIHKVVSKMGTPGVRGEIGMLDIKMKDKKERN